MKRSIIIVSVLTAIAILMSACGTTPITVTTSATPQLRSINVTGTGEVFVTPDIAYISIGVQSTASSVTSAIKDNTTQAQAIRDALSALSVADKDIQTSNFSVNPQQQYGPDGLLKETLYMVNNTVNVTVRDLTKLGQILDAVVKSGANTINGITFDLTDKAKALEQARLKAVDDARSQADMLAKAAGASLGLVQTISVYSSGIAAPMYDGKGGAMMSNSVPVATGQLSISVQANIVWELK